MWEYASPSIDQRGLGAVVEVILENLDGIEYEAAKKLSQTTC